MPLDQALSAARTLVGAEIARAIGQMPGDLPAAMRYALEGGKGLRGFLVIEGARLHDIAPAAAAPAAAGIEALHAYSLVHDDLPCMDDDDLRRGRPTVHRQWDEATAVLAGDALQTLAFALVIRAACPDPARVALVASLAEAAGAGGMVGGQAMDIAAEAATTPLTLDQITTLQAGKTGALLTWSATAGARMAEADDAPLRAYGDALGLAFQIADDILDVEGDEAQVGKALRKDGAAGKATFVSLLGLDAARRRARDLVTQACDSLSIYGQPADTLREAARFAIARRN
jgi:farnesyl diphosphate synthase